VLELQTFSLLCDVVQLLRFLAFLAFIDMLYLLKDTETFQVNL